MRRIVILLALVFLVAVNVGAQTSASNSQPLLPVSYFALPAAVDAPASAVTLTPSPFASSENTVTANTGVAPSTPLSLMPAAPAPPQDVASVFQTYAWQAYFGYTFFRFYELPHITQNTNGFNYGMVYYLNNLFGVEGEFDATHGRQSGASSWFVAGYGGPRVRWSARRGIETWAHALIGYSHFTPQTAAVLSTLWRMSSAAEPTCPFIRDGRFALAVTPSALAISAHINSAPKARWGWSSSSNF